MRKIILFFSILFIFSLQITAQNGHLSFDIEDGIDQVLELHKAAWAKVKKIDGFRIQIVAIAGSHASEKAAKEKEEVEKIFKEIPCYITYFEPNFRVRVGDFRTRIEAYRMLDQVKLHFPGAFIVSDKIFFSTL